MVLFTSFQYYLIQNDVHFVNYCYVLSKTDDKAGYALGHGHLVIYTLLYESTVTLPLVRNGLAKKFQYASRGTTPSCSCKCLDMTVVGFDGILIKLV